MRGAQKLLCVAVVAGVLTSGVSPASAVTWEERSAGSRAWYTALAVVANVLPIASAFVAPKCIQGYILCKLTFAGIGMVAGGESAVMSGGSDPSEAGTVVKRGFSGTWYLTGRDIAGDTTPEPFPEIAPPATDGGGFEPPPI
jgi:hypothetical protein